MSYEVIKATSINGELERVPTGTLKNTDSASARVHKGGGGTKYGTSSLQKPQNSKHSQRALPLSLAFSIDRHTLQQTATHCNATMQHTNSIITLVGSQHT